MQSTESVIWSNRGVRLAPVPTYRVPICRAQPLLVAPLVRFFPTPPAAPLLSHEIDAVPTVVPVVVSTHQSLAASVAVVPRSVSKRRKRKNNNGNCF